MCGVQQSFSDTTYFLLLKISKYAGDNSFKEISLSIRLMLFSGLLETQFFNPMYTYFGCGGGFVALVVVVGNAVVELTTAIVGFAVEVCRVVVGK